VVGYKMISPHDKYGAMHPRQKKIVNFEKYAKSTTITNLTALLLA
jgi:hypothetical protein